MNEFFEILIHGHRYRNCRLKTMLYEDGNLEVKVCNKHGPVETVTTEMKAPYNEVLRRARLINSPIFALKCSLESGIVDQLVKLGVVKNIICYDSGQDYTLASYDPEAIEKYGGDLSVMAP